jgi:hypothetical protein
LSGCVKSALGVATGLLFLTFCAPHKKEIESTWISRPWQNKDREGVDLIYSQDQMVMEFIVSIGFEVQVGR